MTNEQKLLWAVLGLALPHLACAAPGCFEITLPVTASSDANDIAIPDLDLSERPEACRQPRTYNISATFCEPETYNQANAVQLLSHGATYNKLYWSGLGLPEDQAELYDWTRFATDEGYAVLAIDRPGALLEVQQSLEAEVIHKIVKQLRNGEIGDTKFSKVVVCWPFDGLPYRDEGDTASPGRFDALVLTGWSANFVENFPEILAGVLLPGAIELPKRFGNLHPLYLVLTLQDIVREFFYGPDGTFDPAIEQYDWDHRDVVGTGELVSILAGTTETTYAGPVHIIDGELDAAFCSPNGKCSRGPDSPPGNTSPLFPNARNFTYDLIENTGHCLNLHLKAHETFISAHDFLYENVERA